MRYGNHNHPAFFEPRNAALEHIVLSSSKHFYNKYPKYPAFSTSNNAHGQRPPGRPVDKWKAAASRVGTNAVVQNKLKKDNDPFEDDDGDERGWCNKKWCWWSPNQESLTVGFCNETSIHGFKFLGQPKRHISERIFWLISFLLSLSLCVYLIYGVWERYERLPVIVSFQAYEQDMDTIPFPAVTLCNMNKFPKSKVKRIERIARLQYHPDYHKAKQELMFIKSACNAQQSFAKDFHYAYSRGAVDDKDNGTISEENQDILVDFLIENTIPCDQLIRLCILGEQIRNCTDLFKPIITDYGKCCVFNIMPLPLLLQNPESEQDKADKNATFYDNPVLGSNAEKYWPRSELAEWSKWNYDDGFVLTPNSSRPWKQKRAGLVYGLSMLVDPNTEDYFCPVSDSEGMRYILHTPLEMPHVSEFASVADLNKEILIEVHPDVTNADDDIRFIDHKKRNCYYGEEKQLKFFGPYTGGNCIDECVSLILGKRCGCTYFYMPRDDGVRICNNDPESSDSKCIEKERIALQSTLKDDCADCDSLCEDIAYNYETTIAELQNKTHLWSDLDPKYHKDSKPPPWANHKMSVVHIFFGSETTVPKLRKRLYGTTDLIANTGGILGLCLGFSVLSGVEVLYFLTIRSFWKYCRRRMIGRRIANRFTQMFKAKQNPRIINVNPSMVPFYPGYPNNGFHGQNNGPFYGNNGMMPVMPNNMYGKAPSYHDYY